MVHACEGYMRIGPAAIFSWIMVCARGVVTGRQLCMHMCTPCEATDHAEHIF